MELGEGQTTAVCYAAVLAGGQRLAAGAEGPIDALADPIDSDEGPIADWGEDIAEDTGFLNIDAVADPGRVGRSLDCNLALGSLADSNGLAR